MPSDMEQADSKLPEPSGPPRPYTKPAVERIPLNEAQAGLNPSQVLDLSQQFSS